jgi:hypothetical protein
MLADDLDHWLARTHHGAGADQDFADPTIDHRAKVAIVMKRDQCFRGHSEADDMVAICLSRARPSPPNDVSRTNGRQRMVGSTQSVVICGRSDLVLRFRRRPQPRHRRNHVPGKTQQKLAGEGLLAGAGSSGRDW